ncbi:MAG: hypothetical protein U5K37_08875 [Natrialbaceae archaeon]|nr:hypothetical protein [Natrialbaceae archaeon]
MQRHSRRRFLASVTGGVIVGSAGCLEAIGINDTPAYTDWLSASLIDEDRTEVRFADVEATKQWPLDDELPTILTDFYHGIPLTPEDITANMVISNYRIGNELLYFGSFDVEALLDQINPAMRREDKYDDFVIFEGEDSRGAISNNTFLFARNYDELIRTKLESMDRIMESDVRWALAVKEATGEGYEQIFTGDEGGVFITRQYMDEHHMKVEGAAFFHDAESAEAFEEGFNGFYFGDDTLTDLRRDDTRLDWVEVRDL